MALTRKQLATIPYLLTARNVTDAAKASGVPLRTLHRWLHEDQEFQQALREAEQEVLQHTTRRLVSSQEESVSKLLNILTSPTARNGDRIKAARSLLGFSFHAVELRDVIERLNELEKKL